MKSNVSSTFVAWMVSHCKTHSERELFVKQLQQLVPGAHFALHPTLHKQVPLKGLIRAI